jgi:peroxiredoxin
MTAVPLLTLLAFLPADPARVPDGVWKDCAGKEHRVADWKDAKAVVIFFTNTECPVSNFYAPEMEQLAKTARERGVIVLGVYPDPSVDAAAGIAHGKEYNLTFPRLLDPEQTLARGLGVRVTPEVAVLSNKGELLYLGRIDDRFNPEGKRRDEPTVRDLRDALEAVLAGKPVAVPKTKSFGCPLPRPKAPTR